MNETYFPIFVIFTLVSHVSFQRYSIFHLWIAFHSFLNSRLPTPARMTPPNIRAVTLIWLKRNQVSLSIFPMNAKSWASISRAMNIKQCFKKHTLSPTSRKSLMNTNDGKIQMPRQTQMAVESHKNSGPFVMKFIPKIISSSASNLNHLSMMWWSVWLICAKIWAITLFLNNKLFKWQQKQ